MRYSIAVSANPAKHAPTDVRIADLSTYDPVGGLGSGRGPCQAMGQECMGRLGRRAVGLLGLWTVFACGPAPASTVGDWAQTFTASRDPEGREPDISVDIQPSLAVSGAWKISVREHIANAERPLTLELDGVSPTSVRASPYSGDVWGEELNDLDDDVADPGVPQLSDAGEVAEVFVLPQLGIQLALYELVGEDGVNVPAVRYQRARTQSHVTAADVALTAHAMDSSVVVGTL